jgi:hypothetical protein
MTKYTPPQRASAASKGIRISSVLSQPRNTTTARGLEACGKTSSSTPSLAKMRAAFGVTCNPAPNSSSEIALSYMATVNPARTSAIAAVSPAIPAPATIARRGKL